MSTPVSAAPRRPAPTSAAAASSTSSTAASWSSFADLFDRLRREQIIPSLWCVML